MIQTPFERQPVKPDFFAQAPRTDLLANVEFRVIHIPLHEGNKDMKHSAVGYTSSSTDAPADGDFLGWFGLSSQKKRDSNGRP